MSAQQLEQYRKEYDDIQAQALELTKGLDEAKFNWRPSEKEWSIEECIAHLILAGNFMLLNVEAAIDAGKAKGLTGAGPFKFSGFDKFALKHTEPPVKRKAPAPKIFRPLHQQPVTGVVPSFLHLQTQLQGMIDRTDGLDLARIKVKIALPVLKVTLMGAFALTAAHERRHLQQAWRVHKLLPK